MTIAKLQQIDTPSTAGSQIRTTMTPTAGSLLVLQASLYTSGSWTPTTPTDSNGTWVDAIMPTPQLADGANKIFSGIWFLPNATATSHVIDLATDASVAGHVTVTEWSNAVLSASALDKTSSETPSASTAQSATSGTTAATTQANELIVVCVAVAATTGQANAGISNPPSTFTSLYVMNNTASDVGTEFAYKIVSATGAQSASWTWTDASTAGHMGVVATFKDIVAGGSTTNPQQNPSAARPPTASASRSSAWRERLSGLLVPDRRIRYA